MNEQGNEVWAVVESSLQVFVKGRFELNEEVGMTKIGGRTA